MDRTLRTLPLWPAGLPLSADAITLFYDPATNLEYRIDPARLGEAELKKLQEQLKSFNTFEAGQIGKDSPAGSLLEQLKWLATRPASTVTIVQDPDKPDAPTEVQVDDTSDTLSGLVVSGYPAVADYEVFGSPDFPGIVNASAAGANIQNGRIISRSLKGNILAGGAGIRVAANGSHPAGDWMLNDKPFTGVITPPTTVPTGDTVKPDVYFTVPAAGATLTPGTQVVLTVIANDNVAVAGLTFTNGATGAVLGQGAKNGSTYTLPYTPTAAGPLSLVATATDAAGNSQAATVNTTVGSTTQPTPELTAALAISLASVTLGAPVAFTVTPAGGTSPYGYEVLATDTATGQQFTLGTTKSGSWTPTAVGSYAIEAAVTDSSSPAKMAQSATRYLQVVQAANRIPVADAGQDVTVQLPTASVALMGTASDPDAGDTLTYAWRQVTGPNSATGLPATSLNVVVSGLVAGTYQFGFRSTDNRGGQSTEDFVMLTVQAASVGSKGDIDVYFLIGQSNMEGATPQTGRKAFTNTFIYNRDTDAIELLLIDGFNGNNIGGTYPSGRLTTPFFGPEDGIATYLESTNPGRKSVLVKAAYGGATIEELSPGGVRRPLVENTLNKAIARLLADGYNPIVRAVFFDQKEGNSGDETAAYELKLDQFVAGLPQMQADTKFVVMLANVGVVANSAKVRAAQLNSIAKNPRMRYVDPQSRYTFLAPPEDVHYSIPSMRQTGPDYFQGAARPSNSLPGEATDGPTISSYTPERPAPGDKVTVYGTNFASGATVDAAGAAGTNVVVVSSVQLTFISPVGSDIGYLRVMNPDGKEGRKPGYVGLKRFVGNAPADVSLVNGNYTTSARDGGGFHTVIGSTPFAANHPEPSIVYYNDGSARLFIAALHTSNSLPPNYGFAGGAFFTDVDGAGNVDILGSNPGGNGQGGLTAAKISPAGIGWYKTFRSVEGRISVAFNDSTKWFYNIDVDGPNVNGAALTPMLAMIGLPGNKAVDVRQGW
jgi:hypothetical protein